jgi:hypothetical protein
MATSLPRLARVSSFEQSSIAERRDTVNPPRAFRMAGL